MKSGGNIVNGAVSGQVTAQGAACSEIVAQSTSRDGILLYNSSASDSIAYTLIATPNGQPNVSTPSTAQAFAARIGMVPAGVTIKIEARSDTRILISSASGTPTYMWQEYDA